MDKDYYYRTEAAARQAAIEKELTTRHLLREAGRASTRPPKAIAILLRAAPFSLIFNIIKRLRLVS